MKNITTIDAFIAKLGSVIKVISIKNNIKNIRFIKNSHDYFLVRLGLRNNAILRLSDGSTMNFSKEKLYELMLKRNLFYLKKKYKDAKITKFRDFTKFSFGGINLLISEMNQMGVIRENFIEEQYKRLDVKGKTVIDIGANIGDTAVYFSKRGGT